MNHYYQVFCTVHNCNNICYIFYATSRAVGLCFVLFFLPKDRNTLKQEGRKEGERETNIDVSL